MNWLEVQPFAGVLDVAELSQPFIDENMVLADLHDWQHTRAGRIVTVSAQQFDPALSEPGDAPNGRAVVTVLPLFSLVAAPWFWNREHA